MTVGSSSAIFACGAARLGLRVAFHGVVGDDPFGRFMLEELAAREVDVAACVVDPELADRGDRHPDRRHRPSDPDGDRGDRRTGRRSRAGRPRRSGAAPPCGRLLPVRSCRARGPARPLRNGPRVRRDDVVRHELGSRRGVGRWRPRAAPERRRVPAQRGGGPPDCPERRRRSGRTFAGRDRRGGTAGRRPDHRRQAGRDRCVRGDGRGRGRARPGVERRNRAMRREPATPSEPGSCVPGWTAAACSSRSSSGWSAAACRRARSAAWTDSPRFPRHGRPSLRGTGRHGHHDGKPCAHGCSSSRRTLRSTGSTRSTGSPLGASIGRSRRSPSRAARA